VIERGIVEGGEVKPTDRFVSRYSLVQYFRYYSYSYIVKNCRIEARCGHCSGSHETRNCDYKDWSICPNCRVKSIKEH